MPGVRDQRPAYSMLISFETDYLDICLRYIEILQSLIYILSSAYSITECEGRGVSGFFKNLSKSLFSIPIKKLTICKVPLH